MEDTKTDQSSKAEMLPSNVGISPPNAESASTIDAQKKIEMPDDYPLNMRRGSEDFLNFTRRQSADILPDGVLPDGIPLTRQPMMKTPGFIRTIQRRGNVYTIRESLPSESDPSESVGSDQMSEDLYDEILHMSSHANRKAELFKIIDAIATIVMTIAGSVIGVLSLSGHETQTTLYVSAILGFAVTGIQTLLSTFSLEKRAVLLKEVSTKLRSVSRQVNMLRSSDLSSREKLRRIEELYSEVDELGLMMFDNNITSISIGKNSKNTSDKRTSESASIDVDNDQALNASNDSTLKKKSKSRRNILPLTQSDTN